MSVPFNPNVEASGRSQRSMQRGFLAALTRVNTELRNRLAANAAEPDAGDTDALNAGPVDPNIVETGLLKNFQFNINQIRRVFRQADTFGSFQRPGNNQLTQFELQTYMTRVRQLVQNNPSLQQDLVILQVFNRYFNDIADVNLITGLGGIRALSLQRVEQIARANGNTTDFTRADLDTFLSRQATVSRHPAASDNVPPPSAGNATAATDTRRLSGNTPLPSNTPSLGANAALRDSAPLPPLSTARAENRPGIAPVTPPPGAGSRGTLAAPGALDADSFVTRPPTHVELARQLQRSEWIIRQMPHTVFTPLAPLTEPEPYHADEAAERVLPVRLSTAQYHVPDDILDIVATLEEFSFTIEEINGLVKKHKGRITRDTLALLLKLCQEQTHQIEVFIENVQKANPDQPVALSREALLQQLAGIRRLHYLGSILKNHFALIARHDGDEETISLEDIAFIAGLDGDGHDLTQDDLTELIRRKRTGEG